MNQALLNDSRFGQYEITGKLGEGGMGLVFLARQQVPARQVALKIAKPEILADPQNRARFLQEANAAALLQHPHIVPIFEVSEAALDGQQVPYIAMAYIEGETLREYLERKGVLELSEATRIIRQIGLALDHAHRYRIVHRDLKPSNILIDRSGHVYLTDFGLARDFSVPSGLTLTNTLVGTPNYMSPEQVEGLSSVGPASDIYALGLVLYEMLTGNLPFKGETTMSRLVARLNTPPIAPRSFVSSLPPSVEQVLLHCLARQPSDRYHSAAELTQALQQALKPAMIDPTVELKPGSWQQQPGQQPGGTPPGGWQQQPGQQPGGTPPGGWPPPPPPSGGTPPGGWPPPPPVSPPNTPPPVSPVNSRRNLLFLAGCGGLILLLLLVGSGFFVVTNIANQNATATALAEATLAAATANANATAEANATATAIAAAATATANRAATRTAIAQQTTVALASATAAAAAAQQQTVEAAVLAATARIEEVRVAVRQDISRPWSGRSVAGPFAETFPHILDELSFKEANVNLSAFVANANFVNPFDATEGQWDYGISFRITNTKEFRLAVVSDKRWFLTLFDENAANRFVRIHEGTLSNLNQRVGELNELRVVAHNNAGAFYLNGEFVARLNLGDHLESGNVAAASLYFKTSGIEGYETLMGNFRVWALESDNIPDGEIVHEADNKKIEAVTIANNKLDYGLTVTFSNPYSSNDYAFDYGIFFRYNNGDYQAIIIDVEKIWLHNIRSNGNIETLARGRVPNFDGSATGKTVIELLVNGDTGLLLINGEETEVLDLSLLPGPGDISFITGYYADQEITGRVTTYSDAYLFFSR